MKVGTIMGDSPIGSDKRVVGMWLVASAKKGISSHVFTDALQSYTGLDAEYVHLAIDHMEEYLRCNVQTNGLEIFGACLNAVLSEHRYR